MSMNLLWANRKLYQQTLSRLRWWINHDLWDYFFCADRCQMPQPNQWSPTRGLGTTDLDPVKRCWFQAPVCPHDNCGSFFLPPPSTTTWMLRSRFTGFLLKERPGTWVIPFFALRLSRSRVSPIRPAVLSAVRTQLPWPPSWASPRSHRLLLKRRSRRRR